MQSSIWAQEGTRAPTGSALPQRAKTRACKGRGSERRWTGADPLELALSGLVILVNPLMEWRQGTLPFVGSSLELVEKDVVLSADLGA